MPLGALLAFLMVRTDLPGTALARAADAGADLRLADGARLRLRGGARPGRHSTRRVAKELFGVVPWNIYSLPALIVDRRA